MLRIWTMIGVVVVSTLSTIAATRAQSLESFFRGKQVEFISSGEAGSSHDTWARLFARYFPKYMPGNPTFVVQNMPGAGHIIATNYLYSAAPHDGLTIGFVSDPIPVAAALKTQKALKADFSKFSFLGSPDRPQQVCVSRRGAKVQKAQDLMTQPLMVGGAGAGSAVSFIPNFVKAVLGWKLDLIEGYKGGPRSCWPWIAARSTGYAKLIRASCSRVQAP